MGVLNLCFVLLLPLSVCSDSEETLVKTVGKKPDITPICTSDSQTIIVLLVCKIRTERSRGEECRLVYQYPLGFEHGCDSRFTLLTKNQTVFLHLTNLTAEDSGNYTCECSHPDGTDIIHLNITVEDEEGASNSTKTPISIPLIGVMTVIITTGVILRFIYSWCCLRSEASGISAQETPGSLDPPDDTYSSLLQPTNDVYEAIASVHRQYDTNTNSAGNTGSVSLYSQEMDSQDIYENI